MKQNLWPAPVAMHPLDATVVIPGSKSLSNRYLILAALGSEPVVLKGLLRSRDTELMMNALTTLGVSCETDLDDETTVRVTPPASGRFPPPSPNTATGNSRLQHSRIKGKTFLLKYAVIISKPFIVQRDWP